GPPLPPSACCIVFPFTLVVPSAKTSYGAVPFPTKSASPKFLPSRLYWVHWPGRKPKGPMLGSGVGLGTGVGLASGAGLGLGPWLPPDDNWLRAIPPEMIALERTQAVGRRRQAQRSASMRANWKTRDGDFQPGK